MQNKSCRAILILSLTVLSLWKSSPANSAEATLTFTVASNAITAGEPMSVWLNVLNTSGEAITWTFPPKLERKIISAQATFDGSMERSSGESNPVMIASGAFVRR
jgi:hypothetical protein